MVKQAGRGTAEDVVGKEQGFDGGQAIIGIGAALRGARVGGAETLERAWRNAGEVPGHGGGPAPAAVEQEQPAAGIRRTQRRAVGRQPYVSRQRRTFLDRITEKDDILPSPQRKDRAFARAFLG